MHSVANMKIEAAKAAIKKLIAQHMVNLEAQHALECEYRDWHPDADAKFEKLEHSMLANARNIANALALALHPVRYQDLQAKEEVEIARRNSEFDAWAEGMADEHEQHAALVDAA